jgi:NTE family protein
MQNSSHYHESLLTDLLTAAFGVLDAESLGLLREQLRWVQVAGGQSLMEQGEPGDSMYLSVSGRLRAYVQQDDGSQKVVREMGRGQVIGEMSLFTNEPRSATVVAIRDSVLVRLDKEQFDRLVASNPQMTMALTRQIISRLKTEHAPSNAAPPVTIGLVPITQGVATGTIAQALAVQLQRFGRVRVVDAATVNRELRLDIASGGVPYGASELSTRVSLLLDQIEAEHDFVLLVADASPTAWSHLCSRHCDELLLLADASEPAVVHSNETDCLVLRPPRSEAAQILVLRDRALAGTAAGRGPYSHPAGAGARHGTTGAYAEPHRRWSGAGWRRRPRFCSSGHLAGLAGAGHRNRLCGWHQHGFSDGLYGGIGSATQTHDGGGARCLSGQPNRRLQFFADGVADQRRADAWHSVESLLGQAVDIEDMWKNYFCVATNYSQAREEILQSGDLQQSILASIAIPGALPPVVRDGDLLCDGGTFNNFPVDVMRSRRGIGTVIGADLSARKSRRLEFAEVPSSWALLRDRFRPRKARRYKLPALSAYLLNVTILYSMSRQRAAQRITDIYFNPPLERVGLLDWTRIDTIVQQGYEHAREVLDRADMQAYASRLRSQCPANGVKP